MLTLEKTSILYFRVPDELELNSVQNFDDRKAERRKNRLSDLLLKPGVF